MHYEWSFERLIRYAARPAIATERLSELSDGRLLYRLKRSWRDGTNAVIFERQDFMAKLAVLVPAPRAHLTRYHRRTHRSQRKFRRCSCGTGVGRRSRGETVEGYLGSRRHDVAW